MQLIAQIETRHRPDVVLFIARIAHFERGDGGDKFLRKGLGNARLDDKTLRRGADLPGVLVAADHRRLHRLVEVGIVEHDKRIRTAQLQDAFFQRRAGLRANRLPGPHAAGNGHRGDTRIVDHLRNAIVGGIHPAKHPGRNAGCGKDFTDHRRASQYVWRMLKQIAVARQQNRYRAAKHLPHREIPGHDGEDSAHRPVLNDRFIIFNQRRFGFEHRRSVLGIPVAEICRFRDLPARLSDRFSHLQANHLRQRFAARAHRVTDMTQRCRAFRNANVAPLTISLFRKGNGRIDFLLARPGQRRYGFTCGRVHGNRMSGRYIHR